MSDRFVREIYPDSEAGLVEFEQNVEKNALALTYPVVYIHNWKSKGKEAKHQIYVGEANDFLRRTREHFSSADPIIKNWQFQLSKNQRDSVLYVITHPHFNKSLTLDIENRLIDYMLASQETVDPHNRRGNPQKNYYPDTEFDKIFGSIWSELQEKNPTLFLPEEKIRETAIFKASPLHKLTAEQFDAKDKILAAIQKSLAKHKKEKGELIFVKGNAGTGKTVLISNIFYELCTRLSDENEKNESKPLRCCLLVNHEEQLHVYEQISKRLHIDKGNVVAKPTSFILSNDESDPFDVAFVDESHLLWTQGKQAYQGKNHFDDIRKRARITVAVYDRWQVLTAESYLEPTLLKQYENEATENITLQMQYRIRAGKEVNEWLERFVKDSVVDPIPKDKHYEIKIFKTPKELEREIERKASEDDTRLSRLVATYDWPYTQKKRPEDKKYWQVEIGSWSKPWNYETGKENNHSKLLAWAEQPHTIDEVGSTFTIQGFDLNYVGVILGPAIGYENGKVVIRPERSFSRKAKNQRTLANGEKKSFAECFIRNELNILMTRGVNGLYIYACDEALRNALLENFDAVRS